MKKIGLSLMGITIAVLVLYVVFLQECRRPPGYQIPEGKVLVSQGFLDSLVAIANLPPDTIPGDTVRIKGDIVYVPKRIPVPYPIDPEINFYTDSIVNDSINVWSEITVKGFINKWDWRYKPITFSFETIIEKPVPKPMPYEVPISKAGLYGSLGIGGNKSAFALSAELDLITRKDNLYGIQYTKFNQHSFFMFRVGGKLKFGK